MSKNDVNTDEGRKVLDQIGANIERARTTTDAETRETLKNETEALISSLSGKGSIATKKECRDAMAQALKDAAEHDQASTEVVNADDYNTYEGVAELVTKGAARVAEGVRLQIKASTLAKEIAAIGLDMWRRIPNKEGLPDLKGDSHAAKEAMKALYAKAGESFERNYDTEDALTKLQRAVQYQRSNVRAEYLRSLGDPENEDERQRFAKIIEPAGDDPAQVPEIVANHYGMALKGAGEIARERYHAQLAGNDQDAPKEIEASDPDELVTTTVTRLRKAVTQAKPEAFAGASEETKAKARKELEELYEAVKAMITATL